MIRTFMMGGPLMFPLVLISLILGFLTLFNVVRLLQRKLPAGRAGDISLQALPFWGAIAVLLGVLGQVIGHYKMLSVMVDAAAINPKLVIAGLRECLVTTITGLVICIVALLAWGFLRTWQRINERNAAGTAGDA